MRFRTFSGYVHVIVSGLVLLAAVLLVVLQWRLRAEFSLYGEPYSISVLATGKKIGGVNTAALMVLSAIGGIVVAAMAWLFVRGARSIRAGRRKRPAQAPAKQDEG